MGNDSKTLSEFDARKIVEDFLSNHGFTAKNIDPGLLKETKKSPDFEVFKNKNKIFLCEVKTPEHRLNPKTNMYHWDTTFYKLRRFLHTAAKQFTDYDPKHKLPWIVAFTSTNFQLNWTNFVHNIIGAVAYNGDVIRDFRDKSFLPDSNKDVLSMDLILWFQVNPEKKKIYQMKHFVNQQSSLRLQTIEISDSLTPSQEEGIVS